MPGADATPGQPVVPGADVPPGQPVVRRASVLPVVPGAGVLPGQPVVPGADVLPVLPALHGLLPAGGLQRGSVVAAGRWSMLCLALVAGASADGAWCAVAGLPQFGVRAAVDAGLDPDRLLLISAPGAGWPQVVAALLDGCEIVLLRPPRQPSAQLRRKVEAAVRRYSGVLVVAGDWDGAGTRLRIARQEWLGIGSGHGRLRARRAQVIADGRGAWARPRVRWLWLPGPDGSVTAATEQVIGASVATVTERTIDGPVTAVTELAIGGSVTAVTGQAIGADRGWTDDLDTITAVGAG